MLVFSWQRFTPNMYSDHKQHDTLKASRAEPLTNGSVYLTIECQTQVEI